MGDGDKVIDGLQEAAAYFRSSFDAMYGTVAGEKFRGWTDAIEQAIALLKAQEAVEPQFVQDANGAYAACGKCNHKLWKLFGAEFTVAPSEMPRFCSSCGQAVKW